MRVNLHGVFGEVDSLPGCSQVGVSHAVFLPQALRGIGLGTKANAARLDMMKDHLGYDYALCTVDRSNHAQVAILHTNGWKELDSFVSSKTDHRVVLFGKVLDKAP